jgi:NAD(P)-dependent dehydrogenase (short-subunit alcohol dehydrogenase family)
MNDKTSEAGLPVICQDELALRAGLKWVSGRQAGVDRGRGRGPVIAWESPGHHREAPRSPIPPERGSRNGSEAGGPDQVGYPDPCDVSSDEQIEAVFSHLDDFWDGLDIIVHSVAFALREQLSGNFVDVTTREGFRIAHEISSFSFTALAKAGRSMMQGRQGALLTLTYIGADRSVPNYNIMGLAKASLEANVRYLRRRSAGCIRVNAISAGPIRTVAAAGISDFKKLLDYNDKMAPLGAA